MWGSRRGIGLLRTRGIHLEGPAGSAHVAIAPGVGSAGLGIHPGTPPRPLEGVCRRTRVLPGAQISHALRDVLNTEMLGLSASLTAKLLTLSQQRDFVVPEAIGNNSNYCC
jgi:hypothetical protein